MGVDGDGWWNEEWQCGDGTNVLMMWERGCGNKREQKNEKTDSVKTTKHTGEQDRLTNTTRVELITLCNESAALQSEIDSDD